MRKGQTFWVPKFGHFIKVLRVSRSAAWADIEVRTDWHSWTKRQPLVDGRFTFEVQEVVSRP